jgi:predicted ATPase with chaperone activity
MVFTISKINATNVALVGGGRIPQPGEISMAHNRVLFLDELHEFKRKVLEVLHQPLEDRVVTISRSKLSVDYPASMLNIFRKRYNSESSTGIIGRNNEYFIIAQLCGFFIFIYLI